MTRSPAATSSSRPSRPGTASGAGTSTSSPGCCATIPASESSSSSRRPTRSTRVRRRSRPRRGAGLRPGPRLDRVADGRLWLYQGTKTAPSTGPSRAPTPGWPSRSCAPPQELDFTDPLLWVNDPAAAALLARTGWRALYDVTDDWLHAGAHRRRACPPRRRRVPAASETPPTWSCAPPPCSRRSDRLGRTARSPWSPTPWTSTPTATPAPARPTSLRGRSPSTSAPSTPTASTSPSAPAPPGAWRTRATVVLVGPAPIDPAERRRLEEAGVAAPGAARLRGRTRIPDPRRRPAGPARGHAVHRQPGPHQALRVPRREPARWSVRR